MFHDPAKLKVFALADGLAEDIHRATASAPPEERQGLVAQLRRASLVAPLAILEGCAQWSEEDFARRMAQARAAAAELRYLSGLARRLGLLEAAYEERALHLLKSLQLFLKAHRNQGRGAEGPRRAGGT
jgi:four helix bundle protein